MLIELKTPGGASVWVNPAQVAAVKDSTVRTSTGTEITLASGTVMTVALPVDHVVRVLNESMPTLRDFIDAVAKNS